MKTDTDAFAVAFDDPADAQLHWRLEAGPETPLTQSIELYWYQGWARAAYERGHGYFAPRRLYLKGYAYTAEQPLDLGAPARQDAALRRAEKRTPHQWHDEWLPYIRAHWDRAQAIDLKALPDAELSFYLQESLLWLAECGRIHAHMGWTTIDAVERLVNWYLKRFGGPETEAHRLLAGIPNLSTQKGQRLWALSRQLTPPIEDHLANKRWSRLPKAFKQDFQAYVEDYCDDRHRAAQLLPLYRRFPVPEPDTQVQALAAERDAFTAQVRARLKKSERPVFDDLLQTARANHPLTEDHNYWLDRRSHKVTAPIFKEFGRRLQEGGALKDRQAVDFLQANELILWGYGVHDPLRPRVERRRAAHRLHKRLKPPATLGTPPPAPPSAPEDRYTGPVAPLPARQGTLRGIGASAGTVRGKARLAHSPVEALSLRRGEILVCPQTDPHWTPFFGLAAGLVTDSGGSLCHGAVVAREYRLPSVVGTHRATARIKNGQTIQLDGAEGIVQLT